MNVDVVCVCTKSVVQLERKNKINFSAAAYSHIDIILLLINYDCKFQFCDSPSSTQITFHQHGRVILSK